MAPAKKNQQNVPPTKGGRIHMQMSLDTKPGEPKLEWELSANSMVEMITQGRNLCKGHGKKWPQDVVIWEKK
jgi:hypothetical protein